MKEYLLNNLLDREFQRMLFPLNLMQSVLLQPKYRILHGFLTPNGARAHFKCFLGVLVIITINCMKLLAFKLDITADKTDYMLALTIFDGVYYSVSSLVMFAVNCVQSQNNVQLVLKMQHAYRLFGSDDGLKKYRSYNWISITLAAITCLVFLSINYVRDYLDFAQIIFVLSLYYFDGNIIFAIQVIKILKHELKLWLVELDQFIVASSEPNHSKLTKYLNDIHLRETRLFTAYLDIMEAFHLYKCVFQYSILLLAIEDFVHPLIYIQTFLSLSTISGPYDYTAAGIFYALVPSLWVIKNFTLMIGLCVACQQFYLAVSEVDTRSAVICSYRGSLYTLNIQRLCKNVRRLNACARAGRGLRAGGALAVDAALPLRLLALLATYTVVLLQFAFL